MNKGELPTRSAELPTSPNYELGANDTAV